MTTLKSQPSILWVQVLVLVGLQGAITLTWLVDNAYLPQLLTQFGFPASLAADLMVIENALAVVMEALMGDFPLGGVSVQNQLKFRTCFPFISIDVILSSTLFVAIPYLTTFVPPSKLIRRILPLR
jgi:hypothetical protein